MNIIKEYNVLLIIILILSYLYVLFHVYLKKMYNKRKLLKKAMRDFKEAGGGTQADPISEDDAKKLGRELNQSFKNLYPGLHKQKNVKNILFAFFSLLLFGTIIGLVYSKNIPQFSKGECFVRDEVINPEPTEEWHKPYSIKQIEYVVLKIGKNNYYASSTIPSLGDFPISKDFSVKKSNCDIIFQRGQ